MTQYTVMRPTGTCGYPINLDAFACEPMSDAEGYTGAINVRDATLAEYDAACVAALLGV